MKKIIKLIPILLIITIFLELNSISFATTDEKESTVSLNLSEDFKNWDKLSEEEKDNVIMPMATSTNIDEEDKNNANSFLFGVQNFFAKASIPTKYSLTENINVPVKHQGTTGECWAFSMTSVLESYLALSEQKAVIPRYSARHMDYATSETFLDGKNPIGYSREVGTGGNSTMALGYLTNGTGAVLEEDMPFEDNEDKINLSEIQDKEAVIRVTDAKVFPNINKYIDLEGNVTYRDDSYKEYTDEEVTLIRNEIKQYIMKYGALAATTVGNNRNYYSNPEDPMHSAAYFCDNNFYSIDHAITIVGWDDNYSVDNFNPENKPKNPGAYICLNSYGTESFADGYTYVSYDDVNIEKNLTGIMGAEDISEDKNIYQNDFYGATVYLNVNPQGPIGIANVFTKEGNEDEYIEQVQIAASGNVTAEVYVNPSDSSLDSAKLQKVDVDSSTLDATYNTLKLKNPVKITGDKFAVMVKLTATEQFKIGIECNYADSKLTTSPTMFDNVSANAGESYISLNSLQSWEDFTDFKVDENTFEESNLCVKAITTKEASSEPEEPNTNTNNNNNNTNTNNNNQNANTNTGNNNQNANTNTGNNNQNTNTDNNNQNTNTDNNNQNTNTNTDNNNQNTNTNTNNPNTNSNSNSGTGTTNSNNNSNSNSAYYYNGTVNQTLADELLPKTGTDMARWVLPVVIGIFIISYFNYRRYRDIKIK